MTTQHPLDNVFNIEGGSDLDIEQEYGMTEVSKNAVASPTSAQLVNVPDVKDEDDILVETRLDEIHAAAMEAFRNQTAYTEIIEPRFAARNAEVAANYLNIALQAVNSRAKNKVERKRANAPFVPFANQGGGNKSTTNVVIASREEILKMITVDSDTKQV